ncbi:hypothetical protein HanRHA438_Chr11g0497791 [Helianthus annuus]|nr:hypothetical protein HanHA300_Chr11g0397361 [Helianthus annuus]KAJ0517032.1 hypothetical protein HanHA89_Chr11g0420651 [Helianthus annuus]KAJ0685041.1 hypothetical protein HanLR1_Chr11g0398071 [Helianthus annuus]KAJ0688964.1 hypothetical protein HanOQP8_Chr11g0400251 [Helianthus annuus]KAJ0870207.1 hypothetical protein HanRHA438_Chr11g0497791 [Helianthus annuus]
MVQARVSAKVWFRFKPRFSHGSWVRHGSRCERVRVNSVSGSVNTESTRVNWSTSEVGSSQHVGSRGSVRWLG